MAGAAAITSAARDSWTPCRQVPDPMGYNWMGRPHLSPWVPDMLLLNHLGSQDLDIPPELPMTEVACPLPAQPACADQIPIDGAPMRTRL